MSLKMTHVAIGWEEVYEVDIKTYNSHTFFQGRYKEDKMIFIELFMF